MEKKRWLPTGATAAMPLAAAASDTGGRLARPRASLRVRCCVDRRGGGVCSHASRPSLAMLRRLRDLFYLRKLGAACLQPMLGSASGADGAPAPPPATAAARAADERAREKSRVALISQLRSRLLSEALCEAGLRALLPCARTAGAAGGGPRLFGGLRLSLLSEWWARVQTHAAPLPLRGASPSFGVESDAVVVVCFDVDDFAGLEVGSGVRGGCGSGSGFEKSARELEILTAWSEVLCVTCADARTRVAAAAGPRAAALEQWRADLHSLVHYRLLATALSRAASHGSVTAVLAPTRCAPPMMLQRAAQHQPARRCAVRRWTLWCRLARHGLIVWHSSWSCFRMHTSRRPSSTCSSCCRHLPLPPGHLAACVRFAFCSHQLR